MCRDTQSLKGVGGNVIVLEEAAYCDEGLLNEVVYPLLTVQESVLLCISTLLDGGNHYSRLIDAKDDLGRRLFKTIQIDLICDDCKKLDEGSHECKHKMASMPRWLSSNRVDLLRKLLEHDPAMLCAALD